MRQGGWDGCCVETGAKRGAQAGGRASGSDLQEEGLHKRVQWVCQMWLRVRGGVAGRMVERRRGRRVRGYLVQGVLGYCEESRRVWFWIFGYLP